MWKSAKLVPLTAVHLVQALADAGLPPDALNVVLRRRPAAAEILVTR